MTTLNLTNENNFLMSPFMGRSATIIGQVTHDHYAAVRPGGCAFYAARTVQALGGKVNLLSSVGTNYRFDADLKGMNRICEIGAQTTEFDNVYPATGPRIQYVRHQAPQISRSLLPDTWRDTDLLILAPVMDELQNVQWLATRGNGHTSLFLQGFLKTANAQRRNGRRLVVPRETPFPVSVMTGVDSVFLSREDIELFASFDVLEQIVAMVPVVVVTDGERGCCIYNNDTYVEIDVFPVDVNDPTGAGDTFAAAMSLALATGFTVEDAGRLGAAAASIVVEGEGGTRLNQLRHAWNRRHFITFRQQSHKHHCMAG